MTCGMCVKHVTHALEELDGVQSVQVSLQEGQVRVVHDPQAADEAQFIRAISEEGYEAEKLPAAS